MDQAEDDERHSRALSRELLNRVRGTRSGPSWWSRGVKAPPSQSPNAGGNLSEDAKLGDTECQRLSFVGQGSSSSPGGFAIIADFHENGIECGGSAHARGNAAECVDRFDSLKLTSGE